MLRGEIKSCCGCCRRGALLLMLSCRVASLGPAIGLTDSRELLLILLRACCLIHAAVPGLLNIITSGEHVSMLRVLLWLLLVRREGPINGFARLGSD